MNKGLDLIKRQQPEFINDFPTGNISIGVTEEELIELEKELEDYQEIKTYMQQYGIEDIEELRRVIHNDWVIRQKFKTDTANVAKVLEIIKDFVWVENGEIHLGLYGDSEIILRENDFESKDKYDLLREVCYGL